MLACSFFYMCAMMYINNVTESLKKLFKEFMQTKFDSLDEVLSPMNCVYAEFFRKLCNTRLGEFMDCYRQIQATKSGSASLSGQNLRDTLLSQHINLQSHLVDYINVHQTLLSQ